jgi:hypothetical protein
MVISKECHLVAVLYAHLHCKKPTESLRNESPVVEFQSSEREKKKKYYVKYSI